MVFLKITNTSYALSLRLHFRRYKSSLGLWQEDLNTPIKFSIEKHWCEETKKNNIVSHDEKPLYVLPMFPYPSGNLHMGHVRVYSISDTIARFHRLNLKQVIHPIGWDSFGLPAENAATEHKIPPDQWTESNIESMRKQLQPLGFDFNWEREVSTCNPNYYKWTQFIFLKLFEEGLAYQNKAQVNWDPVDQTVLADEQVDEFGCSWRSGAKVQKKFLKQWFIRTTNFAKRLYDGLDSDNLKNWKDIINLQKHWIGECDGVVVHFKLIVNDEEKQIQVWTKDPYKFIHGEFLTISPSCMTIANCNNETSNQIACINPITGQKIPVYITEKNYPEGKDFYIACPKYDEEDVELSELCKFPISENSKDINIESENQKAIDIAKSKNVGGFYVSSKLKDWLISRQRYWGTPIPIIHCEKCGVVPVPYEQLPVELPKINMLESGLQSLAKVDDWVNCKCPKCNSNAKRETDTMDTFVDSSWYYYRFLDPKNEKQPFDKDIINRNMPVDVYIGGKEHAVLHLYYARFMGYFLKSIGWTSTEEPFAKLVVQGMIMGQSYKVASTGKYIPPDEVEKEGDVYKTKHTGEEVSVQWEKMSKSKYNGENPERLLKAYGCDTTRLLILSDVPPETSRNWSDATLPGVLNFQHRIWMTMREFLNYRNDESLTNSVVSHEELQKYENKLCDSRNYFIATTTYHFKHTHKLSVGISRLQGLISTLRNKIPPQVIVNSKEFELALAHLIIMLSPVTPHFCSELWSGLQSAPRKLNDSSKINWNANVIEQKWPSVDDHYKLSLQCKVDGSDRCELFIEAKDLDKLTEDQAIELVRKEKRVAKRISRGLERSKFDLFPGCRAILYLYAKRKVKKVEEIKESVAQYRFVSIYLIHFLVFTLCHSQRLVKDEVINHFDYL